MARSLPSKVNLAGRIRIGMRVPNKSGDGTHPEKISHFRLTSKDRSLLEVAASNPEIGGELRTWTDAPGEGEQWELFTETDQLKVLIPTLKAISVNYEEWAGTVCNWRCDGNFILKSPTNPELEGTECLCTDTDIKCKGARILRLSVQLPDLPGSGVWRLDTKGFNATAELVATCEQLANAGKMYHMIEGVLRLEQRTDRRIMPPTEKSKGKTTTQTFHYAVPVLTPVYTPRELMAGAESFRLRPHTPQITAGRAAEPVVYEEDVIVDVITPTEEHKATMTAFMCEQGMTQEKIAAYWQSIEAKYPITPTLLTTLFEAMKKAAKAKNTQTSVVVETDSVGEVSWRDELRHLLTSLPSGDVEQEILVMDALTLAEDDEATDAMGQEMIARVQDHLNVATH